MHLILTGATGLVGSAVLDAMIRMQDVTRISILSRRPVPMATDAKDPRINVIIHKDFDTCPPTVLDQLKGATGVVWALGISQTQVGKDEYVKITKDYALTAAKAFQALPEQNEPFNFVYVSGNGATLQPGRFTPIFGRVKGETELALSEFRKQNPWFHASSVRPGFVDPATHDAIKSYIPPPGMLKSGLMTVLSPVIRTAAKSSWSPTQQLGQFLVEMAMGKKESGLAGDGIEKIGDFKIVNTDAINKATGI